MNRKEAYAALEAGKKLTHVYFTPEEWIAKSSTPFKYVNQNGHLLDIGEFWRYRNLPHHDKDWEEFKVNYEIGGQIFAAIIDPDGVERFPGIPAICKLYEILRDTGISVTSLMQDACIKKEITTFQLIEYYISIGIKSAAIIELCDLYKVQHKKLD